MRAVWAVLAGCALAACGEKAQAPGARGGPGPGGRGQVLFPVETLVVEAADVEYAVTSVGSVEAFEQVQVTARVAGVVERVAFSEGDEVEKGRSLVEIEPSRYQLQRNLAQANLEKAEAAQREAEAARERREAVQRENPGLIPGEQLESFRTRALAAAADTGAARSALEQAQLNLRDAYVRAPLAGVIQTRTVQTGQYVQPGTVLATLVRREPLLLKFAVPEAEAARVAVGQGVRFRVKNAQGEAEAKITHVAAGADPSSRMVAVTAEVQGEAKDTLRPGAFAEVTVPVAGGPSRSPVVPQTSVRPSERGFLVYVIEGGVARERVVELGLRTPGGLVEVRSGLTAGEKLVSRGGEALRDGVKVREVPAAERAPAHDGGEPAGRGQGGAGGGP